MKFTGTHVSLLFFTSSDLEPEDMLGEMEFTLKLTSIFAPWDESVSDIDIPSEASLKDLCTTAEMCNTVVKNFQGKPKPISFPIFIIT